MKLVHTRILCSLFHDEVKRATLYVYMEIQRGDGSMKQQL